jgi:hypothetical protein
VYVSFCGQRPADIDQPSVCPGVSLHCLLAS